MPDRGFVLDVRRDVITVYVYNVYMPTNPVTYRISPEVDAELKRLAKIHGGTDKALRVILEWSTPNIETKPASDFTQEMQRSVDEMIQQKARSFKGPLLKPKDRSKA